VVGPWSAVWGANMTVVGTEGAVTPHSGTKMVRGASGQNQYISQEWYNAAFRQNAQPYQYLSNSIGGSTIPLGSGGVSFMIIWLSLTTASRRTAPITRLAKILILPPPGNGWAGRGFIPGRWV